MCITRFGVKIFQGNRVGHGKISTGKVRLSWVRGKHVKNTLNSLTPNTHLNILEE